MQIDPPTTQPQASSTSVETDQDIDLPSIVENIQSLPASQSRASSINGENAEEIQPISRAEHTGRRSTSQHTNHGHAPDQQSALPSLEKVTVSPETGGSIKTVVDNEFRKAFPKWPYEGKSLEHSGKMFYVTAIGDTMMLFFPLCFVAVAIMGEVLNGKSVASNSWGLRLITLKRYGVTVFQIMFAAICARGLKHIATWRITHGARIQFLEQMFGSHSVISTLTTQYKLRAYGPVAVALISTWAMSPVGSQATLRLLDTGVHQTSSEISVYYINSNASGVASKFNDPDDAVSNSIAQVYQTSLLAPNSTHTDHRDLWGNVKIPNIEKLDRSITTKDGWIKVSGQVSYSSLIGVPIANLSQSGKSSFVLPSSYFTLNCPEAPRIRPWTEEIIWDWSGGKYQGTDETVIGFGSQRTTDSDPVNALALPTTMWSIGTFTNPDGDPDLDYDRDPIDPMSMYFQFLSINYTDSTVLNDTEQVIAVNCRITYSNVHSRIQCTGKDCQVVAMISQNSAAKDGYHTPLDHIAGAASFFDAFALTDGTNTVVTEYVKNSFMQQYLSYGFNPIGTPSYQNDTHIENIASGVFAERMSRLINSFWLPSLSLEYTTGNFPSNLSAPVGIESTTATLESSEEIFVCAPVWFAFLLLSSLVLFGIALIGYILRYFFTVAPDFVGHVSSLTRDNPHIDIPSGGSSLSGFKRARYLKDVVIRIGDIKSETDIGHIVVMSVDNKESKGSKLEIKRKYE
jgi:hypothetical protein